MAIKQLDDATLTHSGDQASGSAEQAATGFVAPPPPPVDNFSIIDKSNNVHFEASGRPYDGPVTGLANQFIVQDDFPSIAIDNLVIGAKTPNVFIHSGSGDDAISVAGVDGNNVLDGSTGSNFLVGGKGTDQFYIDARESRAETWSTLVSFHKGDSMTLWGVDIKDFNITTENGKGATGFSGLTITASSPTHPDAKVTFAGYSVADLSNGKLQLSEGFDTGSGSLYLYVKGG